MSDSQPVDSQPAEATTPHTAQQQDLQGLDQPGHSVPPSEFVYQLILEQFWGDGVSKREIRSVYTTASDANSACLEYLLRTWTRDQFSLYEISASPQRSELSKVSAVISGDRFHVWVERHPWVGTLDFSSKAIAQRAGKGPNAYILQRTIKDASGGKRRSTTRGIYASRQLARQALSRDELPSDSDWSSDQGYVVEPGGEYAHAISPSGRTAWLFVEVRPLYLSYTRLEQELQESIESTSHLGTSQNPISLEDNSTPASPTALMPHAHLSAPYSRSSIDNPFSPMPSNPDEAGAFVYLVLQLKTIPYTPPILTVEAVAYEIEVANRFGIALLESFSGPKAMFEPTFRDDGCLQGTIEQRSRDEGLTVWVEKRAVLLGEDPLESDLMSEHGSVQLNRAFTDPERNSGWTATTVPAADNEDAPGLISRGQKRAEPEDGLDTPAPKSACLSRPTKVNGESSPTQTTAGVGLDARYNIVSFTRHHLDSAKESDPSSRTSYVIIESLDELAVAIVRARVQFYSALTNMDVTALDIVDNLDRDHRIIQACSRSDPALVLCEIRVEDNRGTE